MKMALDDVSLEDYRNSKDGHNVSLSAVGNVTQRSTVEQKYMGTPADQKEMHQLGRVQQLRVRV